MTQKLLADDLADLMVADHFMHLLEGRPLDTVGLTGLQNYLYTGRIPQQTVVVIVGTPFGAGIQQFKVLRGSHDACFLPQLTDDGR